MSLTGILTTKNYFRSRAVPPPTRRTAPGLVGSLRGQRAARDEGGGAGTPARSESFWVRVSRGGARGGGCTTRCRGGRTGAAAGQPRSCRRALRPAVRRRCRPDTVGRWTVFSHPQPHSIASIHRPTASRRHHRRTRVFRRLTAVALVPAGAGVVVALEYRAGC